MSYDFDYLVFAGRFSPFTIAHQHVVERAMQSARKVVMLVGSCFAAPTPRTPWSFDERALMIRLGLPDEYVRRLEILPLVDYDQDGHWVDRVEELVSVFAQADDRIGLIGHAKDQTSYYLKLFPQWGSVDVENFKEIDATKVRNAYFRDRQRDIPFVAPSVRDFLEQWEKTDAFWSMLYEYEAVETYRAKYGSGPFLAADALVQRRGKILMIQRTKAPGKGLWALPGGFLNPRETLFDAAIRELHEETLLPVDVDVLKRAHVGSSVFDAPGRDPRAHIVSQAHRFDLDDFIIPSSDLLMNVDDGVDEIKVTAADDAGDAKWFWPKQITRLNTYGDHYHIVQRLLAGQ